VFVIRSTKTQAGGVHTVIYPRSLIQYIRSYLPAGDRPSIRIPRTRHAVVTRNTSNVAYVHDIVMNCEKFITELKAVGRTVPSCIQQNQEKGIANIQAKQMPWPLPRKKTIPTHNHHLSAKLVPTFEGGGVLRGQGNGLIRSLISVF
jgi:hypothetical protein